MKTAYFDCFAGAGGDMVVGAMLDAGLDEDFLRGRIESLGIANLQIDLSKVMRCGISATSFKPIIGHEHHHRKLADITEIINRSDTSASVKSRAIGIFRRLAEVEGGIHGKSPDEIGFHEVGSVDSIVDVFSACVGLEALGIEKVYCSRLSVGGGTVKCAHGVMPVPAPATVELLKRANAPFAGGPVEAELLTPTAAAVLTDFADDYTALPMLTAESVGYGAGTKEFDQLPNVLRLILGESGETDAENDCVCLLECNLDDVSGEVVGFVFERLFEAGALDVYAAPIQMKNNRPAVMLSVMCLPGNDLEMEKVIFEEGLTLGIRKKMVNRRKLKREIITVGTEYGEIRIKTGVYNGCVVSVKPEFVDCAEIARVRNIPLKKVMEAAIIAFEKGCG